MIYRFHPAKLVKGFIERFTDVKFEEDRIIYEGDLERWLKQREIIQQNEIDNKGRGFIPLTTINTWLATPLPPNKIDQEFYIGNQLRAMVAFAVNHGCDMFVVE